MLITISVVYTLEILKFVISVFRSRAINNQDLLAVYDWLPLAITMFEWVSRREDIKPHQPLWSGHLWVMIMVWCIRIQVVWFRSTYYWTGLSVLNRFCKSLSVIVCNNWFGTERGAKRLGDPTVHLKKCNVTVQVIYCIMSRPQRHLRASRIYGARSATLPTVMVLYTR